MLPLALGPHPIVVTEGLGAKATKPPTIPLPNLCQSPFSSQHGPNWPSTLGDVGSAWWDHPSSITPAQSPVQPGTGANCGFKSHLCHLLSVGLPRNYHWKLPTFSLLSLSGVRIGQAMFVHRYCDRDGAKVVLPLLSQDRVWSPPLVSLFLHGLGKSQPLSELRTLLLGKRG